MTLEELIATIKIVPEKAAEFILPNEKAFMDFLTEKSKTDRIEYLEKEIADNPKKLTDLQTELATLKPK